MYFHIYLYKEFGTEKSIKQKDITSRFGTRKEKSTNL